MYSEKTQPLRNEPTYSWLQIAVISVISVIVLYALIRGVGHLFGSLRDSVTNDPLVQSAITVAQIASKLKY